MSCTAVALRTAPTGPTQGPTCYCQANPRQLLCRRPGPPQSSVFCLINSNHYLQKKGCGKTDAEKFEVGCYSLFKTKFIDNIAIIGAVALGVAGIELAIVLFACCLGKRMGYTSQYV